MWDWCRSGKMNWLTWNQLNEDGEEGNTVLKTKDILREQLYFKITQRRNIKEAVMSDTG